MNFSHSLIRHSKRTLGDLACKGARSIRLSGARSSFVSSTNSSSRCTCSTPQLPRSLLSGVGARNLLERSVPHTSSGFSISPRTISSGRRSQDKEDESDDDFKPQRKAVSANPEEIVELIQKQIMDNKIMLYMKGTPAEPRCGFSAQVVRILHAQGVSFSSVNILDYPSIRQGVKDFTDWPTIPQVFVNGEFVGGCDVVTQLHQSGELETMFKEANLRD